MIKPGYFKVKYENGYENYISYSEYLEFSDAAKQRIQRDYQDKKCKLYCACKENGAPLTITSDLVVRVSENMNQEGHEESCPKSETYTTWNLQHGNGAILTENGQIMMRVNLPSMFPKRKPDDENKESEDEETVIGTQETVEIPETENGSGEETGEETKEGKEKSRAAIPVMGLSEIFKILNAMAITRQSYSIKKQIGLAAKEGNKADWKFRDFSNLKKLMWGVSEEIVCIRSTKRIFTLRDLTYNKDEFYKNESRQWLSYAQIEKISYKAGRRYQYITVLQPSNQSAYKSVIRVDQEQFERFIKKKQYDAEKEELKTIPGTIPVLVSYIRHSYFLKEGEEGQSWQTSLKSEIVYVEEKTGIMVNTPIEAKTFNLFAEKKVVFEIPVQAYQIGEYSLLPTFAIKRKDKKDILVYICNSKQDYDAKTILKLVDSNYKVFIYPRAYDEKSIFEEIKEVLYAK